MFLQVTRNWCYCINENMTRPWVDPISQHEVNKTCFYLDYLKFKLSLMIYDTVWLIQHAMTANVYPCVYYGRLCQAQPTSWSPYTAHSKSHYFNHMLNDILCNVHLTLTVRSILLDYMYSVNNTKKIISNSAIFFRPQCVNSPRQIPGIILLLLIMSDIRIAGGSKTPWLID